MTLSPAPAALAAPSRAVVLVGDVRAGLASLEPNSVQCVVTSPPYWQLRNYGVPGQIGMEATPEEYVATMVDVFRQVRRVLRPDGVVFVNLGDSYAGSGKGPQGQSGINGRGAIVNGQMPSGSPAPPGLKPKDLVGMPWRCALALQADGWWWRSTIVWAKKACMPESVSDRPTNAWEPILLFSRSRSYFWDGDAVREDVAEPGRSSGNIERFIAKGNERGRLNTHMGSAVPWTDNGTGRNLRNVWDLRGEPVSDFWLLSPEPFPGAHFATFPSEVPRRCILAGSRPGDVILDPFGGAMTTAMVAARLGRDSVSIELNAQYAEMGAERIRQDAGFLASIDLREVGA